MNAFSKLDLCEGRHFSTAIFNSDIQLSLFLMFVFYIYIVCPFVALLKATCAENSHIALSSWYQKAFIFNLLCVLIFFQTATVLVCMINEDS